MQIKVLDLDAVLRANSGVIDALDAVERYARAFDEISREQDAHYSARSGSNGW